MGAGVRCSKCGYNLAGLAVSGNSVRCPECGELSPQPPALTYSAWQVWGQFRWWALLGPGAGMCIVQTVCWILVMLGVQEAMFGVVVAPIGGWLVVCCVVVLMMALPLSPTRPESVPQERWLGSGLLLVLGSMIVSTVMTAALTVVFVWWDPGQFTV